MEEPFRQGAALLFGETPADDEAGIADAKGRFSKARLEAFSDDVIAVVITMMVFDLKALGGDSPERSVQ
jgi:hypothetical protein